MSCFLKKIPARARRVLEFLNECVSSLQTSPVSLSLFLSLSLYLSLSRARGHAPLVAITLPISFVAEGHKESKTELFSWCVRSGGSCSACL